MGGGAVESPLRAAPDTRLIETALWDGACCPRLAGHLARITLGARRLGWTPPDALAFTGPQGQPARLRLLLGPDGAAVETAPLPAPIPLWRLGIAAQRLRSDDPWLAVKSTHRPAYDAARAAIGPLHEVLLLNERGEVCDGSITTLFFDRGQGLRTPPLSSGVLPGVLRAEMLAQGTREEVLMPDDLPRLRLWVGNALRGLCPAVMA